MTKKSSNYLPIYVVIGTRAQLVKTAPVMAELQKRHIPYTFIYTAQHTETIDQIRYNFDLKQPDIILVNPQETKNLGVFGKWLFQAISALFTQRKKLIPQPGLLITHGDTTTCVWGAVLGKITGCQVMHLESGLRSFNLLKPFPEELNRLITFRFTDIYVSPNQWAQDNLSRYNGVKLNSQQNTLYDAIQTAIKINMKPQGIKLTPKYAVVSLHRFENVYNKSRLEKIIDYVCAISQDIPVYFVQHPVTQAKLNQRPDLQTQINQHPQLHLIPRMSFFEFITLTNQSQFVITDGGSNQEELSYMGKPTYILRHETERQEGLGKNAILGGFDKSAILNFAKDYQKYTQPPLKLKLKPSQFVVDYIQDNYLAN